ncbi:CRISPR system precrRNA processing endoribonuclease RAMP protein Cas6 [Bacillus aquiflavi]|uniref:CRISPR system precrRNA processing endoribonuclease RAMP protein Cas6 n=1 Tax=Bacillus aquiflavi TaxID=2672567 RepID=A0A6B3W2F7_9BACI|nr:CRISPR system precrRNA processing endoribonuclease RAMP protein Cas6 [Bacillus aquiflavi]MBA4537820.1 CRISPR system precrRNA processing endoribonuclease RAMP protein Cas6 [Bacillus aquiflavi]NEY82076.1 CRISPR system precrRNA processing endoribonuclease RAMP protein Cas6 [Bacillus aquiflavi]
MMYVMTLDTHLRKKVNFPGPFTRQLHAFLLKMIKGVNPILSKQLHDSKEKTSFAIFVDSRSSIKICSTDREVITCLQTSFLDNPMINVETETFKINEIHVKKRLLSESMQLLDDVKNLKIEFQTPTAFTHSGKYYILPEPKRIFSSALKTYNQSEETTEQLIWDDLLPIIDKLVMIDINIKSKPISYGRFTVNGFVGKIIWNINNLTREEKRFLSMLLTCMQVMGVGTKTTWGMGKIYATTTCVGKSTGGARKR